MNNDTITKSPIALDSDISDPQNTAIIVNEDIDSLRQKMEETNKTKTYEITDTSEEPNSILISNDIKLDGQQQQQQQQQQPESPVFSLSDENGSDGSLTESVIEFQEIESIILCEEEEEELELELQSNTNNSLSGGTQTQTSVPVELDIIDKSDFLERETENMMFLGFNDYHGDEKNSLEENDHENNNFDVCCDTESEEEEDDDEEEQLVLQQRENDDNNILASSSFSSLGNTENDEMQIVETSIQSDDVKKSESSSVDEEEEDYKKSSDHIFSQLEQITKLVDSKAYSGLAHGTDTPTNTPILGTERKTLAITPFIIEKTEELSLPPCNDNPSSNNTSQHHYHHHQQKRGDKRNYMSNSGLVMDVESIVSSFAKNRERWDAEARKKTPNGLSPDEKPINVRDLKRSSAPCINLAHMGQQNWKYQSNNNFNKSSQSEYDVQSSSVSSTGSFSSSSSSHLQQQEISLVTGEPSLKRTGIKNNSDDNDEEETFTKKKTTTFSSPSNNTVNTLLTVASTAVPSSPTNNIDISDYNTTNSSLDSSFLTSTPPPSPPLNNKTSPTKSSSSSFMARIEEQPLISDLPIKLKRGKSDSEEEEVENSSDDEGSIDSDYAIPGDRLLIHRADCNPNKSRGARVLFETVTTAVAREEQDLTTPPSPTNEAASEAGMSDFSFADISARIDFARSIPSFSQSFSSDKKKGSLPTSTIAENDKVRQLIQDRVREIQNDIAQKELEEQIQKAEEEDDEEIIDELEEEDCELNDEIIIQQDSNTWIEDDREGVEDCIPSEKFEKTKFVASPSLTSLPEEEEEEEEVGDEELLEEANDEKASIAEMDNTRENSEVISNNASSLPSSSSSSSSVSPKQPPILVADSFESDFQDIVDDGEEAREEKNEQVSSQGEIHSSDNHQVSTLNIPESPRIQYAEEDMGSGSGGVMSTTKNRNESLVSALPPSEKFVFEHTCKINADAHDIIEVEFHDDIPYNTLEPEFEESDDSVEILFNTAEKIPPLTPSTPVSQKGEKNFLMRSSVLCSTPPLPSLGTIFHSSSDQENKKKGISSALPTNLLQPLLSLSPSFRKKSRSSSFDDTPYDTGEKPPMLPSSQSNNNTQKKNEVNANTPSPSPAKRPPHPPIFRSSSNESTSGLQRTLSTSSSFSLMSSSSPHATQSSANQKPNHEYVQMSGNILARASKRSIILKKWQQAVWVQYYCASHIMEHTSININELLVFRKGNDFNEWLTNTSLDSKARESLLKLRINFPKEVMSKGVRGFKRTPIKSKIYDKNVPPLHNFKLEKWTDLDKTIVAVFASPNLEEVQTLYDQIGISLDRCPYHGLKNIDDLLVQASGDTHQNNNNNKKKNTFRSPPSHHAKGNNHNNNLNKSSSITEKEEEEERKFALPPLPPLPLPQPPSFSGQKKMSSSEPESSPNLIPRMSSSSFESV